MTVQCKSTWSMNSAHKIVYYVWCTDLLMKMNISFIDPSAHFRAYVSYMTKMEETIDSHTVDWIILDFHLWLHVSNRIQTKNNLYMQMFDLIENSEAGNRNKQQVSVERRLCEVRKHGQTLADKHSLRFAIHPPLAVMLTYNKKHMAYYMLIATIPNA